MANHTAHVDFPGRLIFIGFGSIGQGVLPLVLRHIGGLTAARITIVTADDSGRAQAEAAGITFIKQALNRENFRLVLEPMIGRGDFVLNLSVDVSSLALIRFCWERGALYLDTCLEPWAGGYTDPSLSPSRRSNYALREEALALRRERPQAPNIPKRTDEFVNTWSVDGFISEGCQPAELGWGSHERNFPRDGRRHDFGGGAAIYLMQPGAATRVRTWAPKAGPFHGFLITHGEAISIADYFTVRDGDRVDYRPTVHYSYHPCDSAVVSVHEFAGRNWRQQSHKRILLDEIVSGGIDELGVLLAGHRRNAYWYGSQLSIDEARRLAPHNSATSLQVCVSVLGGMVWAIENPGRGLVEPDEMDFRRVLDVCMPYLGPVVGEYSDWNPLHDRGRLFPEDLDESDPWQFKNVRVV